MTAEHEGVDIWTAARRWFAAKHGTDPDSPTTYNPGTAAPFTGTEHPYVGAALDGACSDIAAMTDHDGRNNAVNAQLFRFCGFAAAGHLQESRAVAAIRDAAMASGLAGLELRRLLRTDATGAIAAGRTHPQDPPPRREPAPLAVAPTPEDFPTWAPDGVDPATGEIGASPEQVQAAAAERRAAQMLAQEVATQRVRRAARQMLDDEEHTAHFRVPPATQDLAEELGLPDDPVAYAIDRLVPAAGNVLLTAAFKAGKSTMMNNLARSFADAEPFLGRFGVHAPTGRLALWNYEVSPGQYRRWLRDVGIAHPERVALLNLRGYTVPLTVPRVADWAVRWLASRDTRWWVIDPWARAYGGASENDNAEVSRWLDAVDEIKERAGVDVLFLPTHTGREVYEPGTERARGATRLDDWADVRWLLTRDKSSNRFLRATGRDVDVEEEQLTYDEATRRLTFGGGDRRWVAGREREDLLVEVIRAHPGIGLTALRKGFNDALRAAGQTGVRAEQVDAIRDRLAGSRRISVEKAGEGQPTRHHVVEAPRDPVTGLELPPATDPPEEPRS